MGFRVRLKGVISQPHIPRPRYTVFSGQQTRRGLRVPPGPGGILLIRSQQRSLKNSAYSGQPRREPPFPGRFAGGKKSEFSCCATSLVYGRTLHGVKTIPYNMNDDSYAKACCNHRHRKMRNYLPRGAFDPFGVRNWIHRRGNGG